MCGYNYLTEHHAGQGLLPSPCVCVFILSHPHVFPLCGETTASGDARAITGVRASCAPLPGYRILESAPRDGFVTRLVGPAAGPRRALPSNPPSCCGSHSDPAPPGSLCVEVCG